MLYDKVKAFSIESQNLPFTKANLQNLLTTYTVSFILKQNTDILIQFQKQPVFLYTFIIYREGQLLILI